MPRIDLGTGELQFKRPGIANISQRLAEMEGRKGAK
jgi:hypothetical protein